MKTVVRNAENDTKNAFPYKNILLFWGGGGVGHIKTESFENALM